MATTTQHVSHEMTWESFEKLPDGDGFHRELIEGELQVLPPVKFGHSKVAKRIFKALLFVEESGGGQVYFEAGFKLSTDRASWIQPDVSFVRAERIRDTPDSGYFLGAPDLAIEVVSPSESAADVNRKVELLLKAGSLAVWVLYPKLREVRVFLPKGVSYRKCVGDTLTMPELLPGWEFPVARLFED
jgi:Uma2 family endonuclease